jgi:hypothetical protein
MTTMRRPKNVRGLAVVLLAVIAGVMGPPVQAATEQQGDRPTAAVSASSCRAVNLTSGAGPTSRLQRLIDRAAWGDRIQVRGVCKGNFAIRRDLTLIGKATRTWPTPTMDGNSDACDRPCFVMRVTDADVGPPIPDLTVRDITVTGGEKASGAGILKNAGTLTLRGNTNVVGNWARRSGGGVYSLTGDVILRGHAVVQGNRASRYRGGGIYALDGVVILKDHSKVAGNVAHYSGGGISGSVIMANHAAVLDNLVERIGGGGGISGSRVVMRDDSRVCRNTIKNDARAGAGISAGQLRMHGDSTVCKNAAIGHGSVGGGVYSGDVVLDGRASVTANSAVGEGGGIWSYQGALTFKDHATVTANSAAREVAGSTPLPR